MLSFSSRDGDVADKKAADIRIQSNKKVKTSLKGPDPLFGEPSEDQLRGFGGSPTKRKVSVLEKRRLWKKWMNALIIKLLGHSVGYNFLVRRLRTLWQIVLAMDVIDVGNDVFAVHFADREEYERAFFNGPW
ncbi:hypothetical protein PTKIN_Ptkin16aG0056900 [Pterospermum kingtungense]